MACDHNYAFKGVVYWSGEWKLPGSGAYPRIYGDAYYCTRCLDEVVKNHREHGNTYQTILPGAMPK